MGNDGGSIPKRSELVKAAERTPTTSELKATTLERQSHLWGHCNLDLQQPLSSPIVSDALGRLFCKESVIQWLLAASTVDDVDEAAKRKHVEQTEVMAKAGVESLKDILELKPQVEDDRWICPVTGKELGPSGKGKAVYIVPCGHVFSETAIKNVRVAEDDKEGTERGECLTCNESYAPNDVIPILPVDEIEITRLVLRMQTLKERGLTHSLKKLGGGGKKRKKEKEAQKEANGVSHEKDALVAGPKLPIKESLSGKLTPVSTNGTSTPTNSNGINDAGTASITAKVLQEQENRNKKRKLDKNQTLDSLFSSSREADGKDTGKNRDFMSRGFAIPAQQR